MIITGSWQMRFTIIKKKLPKKQARNIQDLIAGQDHAESLGLRLAVTYKTLFVKFLCSTGANFCTFPDLLDMISLTVSIRRGNFATIR